MDVASVITVVYTLAKKIHTWLDERIEKNETIRQLSATVFQIQSILLPLQSMTEPTHIEQQTLDAIKGIGDVLKRTQEHLLVWEYKRSHRFIAFISPSTAIRQLKDDEMRLSQQLVLLITCITVIGYVEHRRNLEYERLETISKKEKSELPVQSISGSGEVKEFWRDYVGEKIPFVAGNDFISRLNMWLGEDLNSSTRERLLLRLDEYGIGGVTPSNLEKFIGSNSMRYIIEIYSQEDRRAPTQNKMSFALPPGYQNIWLPLLVWIDDNPENNSYEVSVAEHWGIDVIQLNSTAVAKAWVDSNDDFLRQYHSLVRFISDNHRDEPASGPYLNLTAGETILRYLRGRRHNIPVLIYCGTSISATAYVANYSLAGSTCSSHTCVRYIAAFAGRIHDTGKWMGPHLGLFGPND